MIGGANSTLGGMGMGALAASLRTQISARQTREGLELFGLADPDLSRALQMVERDAETVGRAAVRLAGVQMTGRLIDRLA